MNDKALLNETLSALLDNEAGKTDSLELRRLVRAMEQDPALAATFARYARHSALLRGESATVSADFLAGVRARVESPAQPASTAVATQRWRRVAGQVAVAASVAVLAVWLAQSPQSTGLTAPVPQTTQASPIEPSPARLGDGVGNRLLAPRTLTVSAGDAALSQTGAAQGSNALSDCVIVKGELPADSKLRLMSLPSGYVLCQLDSQQQRCHALAAALACNPR